MLLVLRRDQPQLERPFRLWGAGVLGPLAFVCSNWLLYWTSVKTDSAMYVMMIIVFALYALYYYFVVRMPAAEFGWRYIAWLLAWFGGMWILSAIGDVDGGAGRLTFWRGVIAVAVWSLIAMELAIRSALPAMETAEMMARMKSTI